MQSSRDAPLSSTATEPALVCQGALSSRPSSSQPGFQLEDHVIPKDMDLKFETQPDNQDGEEEDAPGEADVEQDGELSAEEIEYLEEFPAWKEKQEKLIATLQAFAEDAERISRTFAQKKMWNKFATVASELVSIAGLALAPMTAGGSLILTGAGQVGVVVSVLQGIMTELNEKSSNDKLLAEANSQVPNPDQKFEDTSGKKTSYFTAAGQVVYKCGRAWEMVSKRMHTVLPSKPLISMAGRTLPRSVLPVAKAASVYGGPVAVLSLATDVYSLRDNWKKLKNEAKAELAEDLRDRAKELEDELIRQSRCYNMLIKKLGEKQPMRSSLKKAKEIGLQLPKFCLHQELKEAGSQGIRKEKAQDSDMK